MSIGTQSPSDQIVELLDAESVAKTAQRERNAFDQAAYPCERRVVIYGAGQLGRRVLAGLRANGLEAVAFADRNPAAWSRNIEGIKIFSPEEAVRLFASDSVFVIAVWNPVTSGGIGDISTMLAGLGCRRIVPFVWLFWKYPATFLPYYLWDLPSRAHEAAASIHSAFNLFEDTPSQAEFIRQLQLRLTGDVRCLGATMQETQYFPRQLFSPRPDEYLADCGAYDGDTLLSFAHWTSGQFRGITAVEPDPANFAALERCVSENATLRSRVRMVNAAVGSSRSKVRFDSSGLSSASICNDGPIEVDCLTIDALFEGAVPPTYLKMDIEGAELEALDGAGALLRSEKPLLAICAYHLQDHLWQVPLRIRRLIPDSRLMLRPYCLDGLDLVCYAVPFGRIVNSMESAEL